MKAVLKVKSVYKKPNQNKAQIKRGRKMKKKIVTVLLALTMVFSVTACGAKEVISTDYEDTEDSEGKDEEEDSDKEDKEEDKENGENTEATASTEENKEDEDKPAAGVVLGGEFDKDYDGFEYLYCETLMTESEENAETGKMESQELQVFLPKADYASVNRDTAYAEELGVDFRISLNPYIRYEQEDYLPEENLAYYLEYNYDPFYRTDCRDIEMSEVQVMDNAAYATVKYCYYDRWEENYIPIFCTYYLTELSKDVTVLVEVEINAEDVKGKTNYLIEELETFYAIDIAWDKEEAQAKLDKCLATADTGVNTFSTGFLLFELPAGWEQDYDYNDYMANAYAPGGDVDRAGCVIDIKREYMGSDSFDMAEMIATEEDAASYAEYLEETLGDTAKDIVVEYYGTTNLGNAIKVSFRTVDGDYEDNTVVYMITDEDYVYSIEVIAVPECTEDVFTIAENILTTGIVKE